MERSKEENKHLFDRLMAKQAELESRYGQALIWDRGNDKKISRIYSVLEGVSISNQTDWLKMANYMAEWSRKMYVAFVPVIKNIIV